MITFFFNLHENLRFQTVFVKKTISNIFLESLGIQCQLRNVIISRGPRFKIFAGPHSRSAKGTSRAPYMHEFSKSTRAWSPGKFLNLDSLKCHFADFGGEILQNSDGQKTTFQHNKANVFALHPEPAWGPPFGPLGLGVACMAGGLISQACPILGSACHAGQVGGPRVLPVRAHSSYATVQSFVKENS